MKRLQSALLLFLSSCLAPDAPPTIRWFDPALPAAEPAPDPDPARGRAVRVGVVEAAQNLEERIVWRRSDVETGFFELQRWNEPPPVYVQRALERELFERRGAQRSSSARDPWLSLKLHNFEHDLVGEPAARVRATVHLATNEGVWFEQEFEVREPVNGDDPAELARAMGRALDALAREAGAAISVQLGLRALP